MRGWLALIAALVLATTPVVAQGKTKAVKPPAVVALEMCELFVKADPEAMVRVEAMGWHVLESTARNPYVRSYTGVGEIKGLGGLGVYAFVEDFPASVHSSCELSVKQPLGDGYAYIQDIQNLERYEGTSQLVSNGSFASLSGLEDKSRMLLLEATNDGFSMRLYVTAPKPEAGA